MFVGRDARMIPGLLIVLICCGAAAAQAEERNGLSVVVVKKTLDRADRSASFYNDRIDRTQGLKVTIKNSTFKPMPDGEIEWMILVRQPDCWAAALRRMPRRA